jgi:hypothetical protein
MKRLFLPLLLLITALLVAPILAQDNPGLEIRGTVTVIDETTIQVGGLMVDISGMTDIVFEDGLFVTVTGNLEGTLVVAISIVIETPEAEEPEVTPEPEATEEPDEVDVNITIVIEGPVQTIVTNIITIYNIEIELPENDPRITVVQVGDMMRVRGHHKGHHRHDRGALIIVALVFDFVDIDVIVFEGQVWRDTLICAIAPPVWADALAVHWHGRCDAIIIVPGVPAGCKITGMGGIKCSNKGSRR